MAKLIMRCRIKSLAGFASSGRIGAFPPSRLAAGRALHFVLPRPRDGRIVGSYSWQDGKARRSDAVEWIITVGVLQITTNAVKSEHGHHTFRDICGRQGAFDVLSGIRHCSPAARDTVRAGTTREVDILPVQHCGLVDVCPALYLRFCCSSCM